MSKHIENLKGQRFGKLLVLNEEPMRKKNLTYWKCKCECGNEKYVYSGSLKNGSSKSCGCVLKSNSIEKILIKKINSIKQRCCNPNNENYKNYGAKGIKVCKEWRNNSKSFCEWALKNGYKQGLTLDRIDNSKGYSPENCRWATYKEQENNRTNNLLIKINDEIKTLSQWADYYKVSYSYFRSKVRYNKNKGYFTLKNGIQVKFEIIK